MLPLAGNAFVLDPAYAERVAGTLLPRLKFTRQDADAAALAVYDTVDWRIWHAGLALIADEARVALVPLGGDSGGAYSLKLPAGGIHDAHSLPKGRFRQQLQRVAGDSGLIEIARIHVETKNFTHRNSEGKIDCRVGLLHATVNGLSPLPPLVIPQPLRGYERACSPLVAAIGQELASAPPPAERLRVWLHAVGRHPDDTTPPAHSVCETMPAGRAVAKFLHHSLATIQDRAPLAIQARDPERLHEFRVAARQARGLLKALGHLLPTKVEERGRKGLRWLGKLSTPVRDLDVLLTEESDGLSKPLRHALSTRREHCQAELCEALRSDRYRRFVLKWNKGLKSVANDGPSLREAADRALMQAASTFVHAAQALTPSSPPADLHELRKFGKQLRYLLDFFRPLYPKQEVQTFIAELKAAQNGLGRYQDLTAHQELLGDFEEGRAMVSRLADEELERRDAAVLALGPYRKAGALERFAHLTGTPPPAPHASANDQAADASPAPPLRRRHAP